MFYIFYYVPYYILSIYYIFTLFYILFIIYISILCQFILHILLKYFLFFHTLVGCIPNANKPQFINWSSEQGPAGAAVISVLCRCSGAACPQIRALFCTLNWPRLEREFRGSGQAGQGAAGGSNGVIYENCWVMNLPCILWDCYERIPCNQQTHLILIKNFSAKNLMCFNVIWYFWEELPWLHCLCVIQSRGEQAIKSRDRTDTERLKVKAKLELTAKKPQFFWPASAVLPCLSCLSQVWVSSTECPSSEIG